MIYSVHGKVLYKYYSMLCYAILYYTILYYTILYYTVITQYVMIYDGIIFHTRKVLRINFLDSMIIQIINTPNTYNNDNDNTTKHSNDDICS